MIYTVSSIVGGNELPAAGACPPPAAMTAVRTQSDSTWSKRKGNVSRVAVKGSAHTWRRNYVSIWCFLGSFGVSDYVHFMSISLCKTK